MYRLRNVLVNVLTDASKIQLHHLSFIGLHAPSVTQFHFLWLLKLSASDSTQGGRVMSGKSVPQEILQFSECTVYYSHL